MSNELLRFYFNNEPISLNNSIGRAHVSLDSYIFLFKQPNFHFILKIYADAITIYPVRRIAWLMAKVSKQPIYFYLFDYEGPYSLYHWSDGRPYGMQK